MTQEPQCAQYYIIHISSSISYQMTTCDMDVVGNRIKIGHPKKQTF